MLEIKSFIFGPFETNCYVVSDENGHVLLVDPACAYEWEQQELYRYICDRLRLADHGTAAPDGIQIIATHGHLDHLWGARWACETWKTPVLMHPGDIPMAKAMQQQYDLFGVRRQAQSFPIEDLKSSIINHKSEILNHKSSMSNFQLLETPGHTPGCVCLYWPEEKVLLSGDTLFRMGYGRTDLPGGNSLQLFDSLEKLFTLPSDVCVYPGHGEFTTIGAEKR